MWRRQAERLFLLTLTFAVAALARAEPATNELGLWLRGDVAPKLVRHIGRHPRFAGTTLEFVALDGGRPSATTNALINSVNDYLQHRLLEQSQARVAWQREQDTCAVERDSVVFIGVDIEHVGQRNYQVRIGALDPEERVWLAGTSFRWRGPLVAADRRALGTVEARGVPGSRVLPLPRAAHGQVADAFAQRLRCQYPYGLTGPASLTAAKDADAALREVLVQQLEANALVRFVDAKVEQDDGWVLELASTPLGGGLTRLTLLADQVGRQQSLAAVYVRSDADATRPTRRSSPRPQVAANGTAQLNTLEATGVEDCVAAPRGGPCQLVELELEGPAYLFSFRTQDGRVEPNQCEPRAELADPGRRRYRLPMEAEADVVFYAVATTQEKSAKALARLLRETGSYCGRGRSSSSDRWLARLERIEAADDTLVWRALPLGDAAEQALARR